MIKLKKELLLKTGFTAFAVWFFLYTINAFSYPWGEQYTLLTDSDCYMRLLRVVKLQLTHAWYDSFIDWSNAPYGEELHWTRVFDIILWLGALIGTPHFGFFRALHWWGVIISPILGVLSFFSMLWAITPNIKRLFSAEYYFSNSQQRLLSFSFWKFYLFLLFMGMVTFWSYAGLGRPDHHSLLLLLFVLSIGCLLRMVEHSEYKYYIGSGAIAALAVWVSIESLVIVAFINCSMLLLWIFQPYIKDTLQNISAKACSCSMWLFVGSILAVIIEKPLAGFTVVEYDKISFVHIFVFLLLYIFWLILSYRPISTVKQKLAAAIFLTFVGLLSVYIFYPKFLKGPFVEVDPTIIQLWLHAVSEVQPLMWNFSAYCMERSIKSIGMVLFVFPYIVYKFLIKRERLDYYWVVTLVGLLMFFSLTLYQVRWASYCEIIMILPMMVLFAEMTVLPVFDLKKSWLSQMARIGLVAAMALLPVYVPKLVFTDSLHIDNSNIISLDFLRQLRQPTEQPKIILTYIDNGPEIMYFTHNYVVATPYHRNSDGILYLYNVMTAETDAEAYALLEQRKVDIIALYPYSQEGGLYLNTEKDDTFYKRFLSGAYPAWLEPIEVPEYLQGRCYLFKVLR